MLFNTVLRYKFCVHYSQGRIDLPKKKKNQLNIQINLNIHGNGQTDSSQTSVIQNKNKNLTKHDNHIQLLSRYLKY